MAYNVKNSAGQTVANVPDRHIDTDSTSLSLIGYNVTNYGLEHAENFIHLLENFSSEEPPLAPMTGQLWFDSSNQILKIYVSGIWKPAGSGVGPSVGGDPFENGLGGVFHLAIVSPATSVLLFFAGGTIVMIISPDDLAQAALPASVVIGDVEYPLSSLFPYGVQAGATMAEAAADYLFEGKVRLSEQAHFTGGGDANRPAGWSYLDLGANTISMMVANGQIICVVSQVTVAQSSLPVSVTISVRLDDHTIETTSVPFRSNFAGGLAAGFTFSSGVTLNGFVTAAMLSAAIGANYATITEQYQVYVDSTSATAQKITLLETKFLTAAGTSSFSTAIDTILSQSSDTAAVAIAITNLKTEFATALGQSSWSNALTRLTSISTATDSSASSLTQLQSAFTAATGETTFATAINKIWTQANAGGSLSGWSLSLDTNGYVTGIEALNGGASHNYLKVTTSNFIVGDNNIDFIPFQVKDGVVYIKTAVIEDLTVGTDKITAAAINRVTTFTTTSQVNVTKNTVGTVASFSVNKDKADSLLKITGFLSCNSNDDINCVVYLYRDGIQIKSTDFFMIGSGDFMRATIPIFAVEDGIAAGNHSYELSVYNYEQNVNFLTILTGALLEVQEIKK